MQRVSLVVCIRSGGEPTFSCLFVCFTCFFVCVASNAAMTSGVKCLCGVLAAQRVSLVAWDVGVNILKGKKRKEESTKKKQSTKKVIEYQKVRELLFILKDITTKLV